MFKPLLPTWGVKWESYLPPENQILKKLIEDRNKQNYKILKFKFFLLNKNIFIFLLGWYFDENSTIYNLPAEIILSIAKMAYYSEGWPEYLLPLVEMRFVLFLRIY